MIFVKALELAQLIELYLWLGFVYLFTQNLNFKWSFKNVFIKPAQHRDLRDDKIIIQLGEPPVLCYLQLFPFWWEKFLRGKQCRMDWTWVPCGWYLNKKSKLWARGGKVNTRVNLWQPSNIESEKRILRNLLSRLEWFPSTAQLSRFLFSFFNQKSGIHRPTAVARTVAMNQPSHQSPNFSSSPPRWYSQCNSWWLEYETIKSSLQLQFQKATNHQSSSDLSTFIGICENFFIHLTWWFRTL